MLMQNATCSVSNFKGHLKMLLTGTSTITRYRQAQPELSHYSAVLAHTHPLVIIDTNKGGGATVGNFRHT